MRRARQAIATISILALSSGLLPLAAAPAGAARLEGLVVGVDGRPAAGTQVHLIDAAGREVAHAAAGADGVYSFAGVEPGSYAMGLESSSGARAPVAAPAVRLGSGKLVRRDLKLVESDAATVDASARSSYGLGAWWAGLSPAAKVGTIIGLVAVIAITVAALDSDDEPASSPSEAP